MDNYCFPVFKGLQKPLEFMGLRGRFITLAAISIGVCFFGYLLFSTFFGQLIGFIVTAVLIILCLIVIYMKQKQGLHSKKRYTGIVIYKNMFTH